MADRWRERIEAAADGQSRIDRIAAIRDLVEDVEREALERAACQQCRENVFLLFLEDPHASARPRGEQGGTGMSDDTEHGGIIDLMETLKSAPIRGQAPKPDNLEEKARGWLDYNILGHISAQTDGYEKSLASLLRSTVAEAVKEKDEEIAELAKAVDEARRDGAREMREAATKALETHAERPELGPCGELYCIEGCFHGSIIECAELVSALPLPEGGE